MTGTAMQIIQWLTRQKPEVRFDIKQHREKRSLDANGYYWKLVTEMADNLRMAKPEVHNIMLRRYGQAEGVDGHAPSSERWDISVHVHRSAAGNKSDRSARGNLTERSTN